MVGAAAHRTQDPAFVLVRAQGVVGHGIDNFRLVAREGAVTVGQVVFSVVLMDPGGLEEFFQAFDDMHLAVVGDHVVVQFDAAASVLPHEHVGLPVIVDEHAGVDEIAVTDDPGRVDGEERMPQRILERAVRAVRDGHADVFDIGRIIQVILPVPFHAVRCPGVLRRPGRLLEGPEDHAPVLEGLHVAGHIDMVILHVEAPGHVPVVAGIHVQRITEHMGRRVRRIHVRDDGIAAQFEMLRFRGAGD